MGVPGKSLVGEENLDDLGFGDDFLSFIIFIFENILFI